MSRVIARACALARDVQRGRARVVTILIAEHDDEPCGDAAAALAMLGHHTITVTSSADLRARLDDARFDAMLVDDRLAAPGWTETWHETCRAVRAHPRGRATPLLVMSTRPTEIVSEVVSAGGDDVVERPLRARELEVRIRVACAVYEARRREHDEHERLVRRCEELARNAAQEEALTEFLVHDLKSPLASLTITLQELLARGVPDGCSIALRSCLSATDVAGRMVMNLLDLSQARRLEVRPASCVVDALFTHLAEHFAPRLEVRGVALRTRAEVPALWADRDLLQRIAENLLDNALRYTGTGTAIEIVADADERGGLLTVIDRGPGVPVVHRERIFDRFVQLDPSASQRASRGLGLAFCRLAVDAHGGRIWVDDAPGGGARFRAMFPGPGGRAC